MPASPGRLLRRLAELLVRGPDAPYVLGDLDESFRRDVERGVPPRRARLRFLRNALASAASLGAARARRPAAAPLVGAGRAADGTFRLGIGRDLAHAVRALGRSWMFSTVCLLSLAAGLGIMLAVHMLFRATMDPPFALDTDGLVEVLATEEGQLEEALSYPDFVDLQGAAGSLRMAGWALGEGSLRVGEEAGARVSLAYVSPGYFEILRVAPARGRGLASADAGGAVPVVLHHAFWQNELGGDPRVVGQVLSVNRRPHVVVGVAPEGFTGHRVGPGVHAWVPLESHPALAEGGALGYDRGEAWLGVVGRLSPGSTRPATEAEVAAAMAALAADHPATNAGRGARVLSWQWQGADVLSGGEAMLVGAIFVGLPGVVLLIVCLNLAGMVFVRSASRERELALRLAIGSGRRRLVQHLMAEAVVLAALGGALVTAVLWGSLRILSWRLDVPLPANLRLDAGTVAVGMGLAFATTLVFGLLPALRFSRPHLLSALKDDGGTGGRRSGRFHRWAATLQTALTVPVVVVAAGVTQGALSLGSVELGVQAEGLVALAPMDLEPDGYDAAGVEALGRSLAEAVRGLPGVERVAVTDGLPLAGTGSTVHARALNGAASGLVGVTRAGPGYLETLGVPLLRGRALGAGDGPGAEPVAVITASLAAQLFPDGDPLGRRVGLADPADPEAEKAYTVVGVSGDVAGGWLESSTERVFLSLRQEPATTLALAVRASSVDDDLLGAIRDAPSALDRELARPYVASFDALVEDAGADIGVWSVFFSLIASLLLLLSALGVYGVIGFTVASRSREIGVRMSLGSSRPQVLRMVLHDALRLALPGVVVGGLAGVAIGVGVMNQIYVDVGLPLVDAPVLALAAVASLAVVLAAAASPARRAASVDPIEALRAD